MVLKVTKDIWKYWNRSTRFSRCSRNWRQHWCSGCTGAQGHQGQNGTNAGQGAQGAVGAQGSQGHQGNQGTAGTDSNLPVGTIVAYGGTSAPSGWQYVMVDQHLQCFTNQFLEPNCKRFIVGGYQIIIRCR